LRSDETGVAARKSNPEYKCNGCDGSGIRSKWATDYARIAGDQLQVKDIPFIALRNEAETKALKFYDRAVKIINGRDIPVWNDFLEGYKNIDEARTAYNNNEVVRDFRNDKELTWEKPEDFKQSREEASQQAKDSAICLLGQGRNRGRSRPCLQWRNNGRTDRRNRCRNRCR
jgi:hypothetical protein